jgi:hypothetical protein
MREIVGIAQKIHGNVDADRVFQRFYTMQHSRRMIENVSRFQYNHAFFLRGGDAINHRPIFCLAIHPHGNKLKKKKQNRNHPLAKETNLLVNHSLTQIRKMRCETSPVQKKKGERERKKNEKITHMGVETPDLRKVHFLTPRNCIVKFS